MRLFVAVWPPPPVVDVLAALPRPSLPGVRWTTPDQWHVTLHFFGPVEPALVPSLVAALPDLDVPVTIGPATARLGRSILVVPVDGLDEVAASLPWPAARPFRGHLTLARAKGALPAEVVGVPVAASWRADRATIVSSETLPTGARYTILEGA